MKISGTSGLKRHLKAKHGMLFDKEFSKGCLIETSFNVLRQVKLEVIVF